MLYKSKAPWCFGCIFPTVRSLLHAYPHQVQASSYDERPCTVPSKNTSLENIGHIEGHFGWYVCVMDTETQATAALYIKQNSMWIAVCPNIAVLHSYLSLLMEFNDIRPTQQSTFVWWQWREADWEETSGWGQAVNSLQNKCSFNRPVKLWQ